MQGSAACKRDVLCRKLCPSHCLSRASSRTLSCNTVTWWSQSSTTKGKMVRIWDACTDIAKLVCCEALLPCITASVLAELHLGCCACHFLAQPHASKAVYPIWKKKVVVRNVVRIWKKKSCKFSRGKKKTFGKPSFAPFLLGYNSFEGRGFVLICVDSGCWQQYMGAVLHDAIWELCNMSQYGSIADLEFDTMISSKQACHSSH